MATISKFKCSKCGKEFSLKSGLFQKDLVEVTEGSDLPGGGKLLDKESFTKLANEKTTADSFNFNNALIQHQKDCGGEVKFMTTIFAH